MNSPNSKKKLEESEIYVEDRLLNYKWKYEKNKKVKEEELYGNMFHPKLKVNAYSQRIIPDSYINSGLPLKSKKMEKSKTQKWLEKEKKRLLKDISSPKKVKSHKILNLSAKSPKNLTEIDKFKLEAINLNKESII